MNFYRLSFRHRYYGFISVLAFILFLVFCFMEDKPSVQTGIPSSIISSTILPDYLETVNEIGLVKEQVERLKKRGLIIDCEDSPGIKALLKKSLFEETLPHLTNVETDNVNPKISLSFPSHFWRSPPKIILALPTMKRATKNYFKETMANLMSNLREYEWHQVLFLIYIVKFPESDQYTDEIVKWLKETFPKAVEQGLFEIIESPSSYYPPDLDKIKPTFNDSQERMQWRVRQNLDYVYLMTYARIAHSSSTYYLQLEDDIVASPGYVSEIIKFASSKLNFLICDFSNLGFIGKLFHISDLQQFIESILLFYKSKPGDWILNEYFTFRFCSPTESIFNCTKNRINDVNRFYRKPALFQHVGRYSSLNGKIQLLREKEFQRSATNDLHIVNDYKDIKIETNGDLDSSDLLTFFQKGSQLRFDSPSNDLFLLVKFKEPILIKDVEVRFAYKSNSSIKVLPIMVEVKMADSRDSQQLGSASNYGFHYHGANQLLISQLRVSIQKANTFDYFMFTFLRIRQ